ncbi:hypothetical protein CCMA1212_007257 [Trichoderma ghanense]|uniref:Uncharacterized protein n=1 Tax=Trichoderma ghanense TaxID=65468 RepID=A0ABY2GY89_9HYPO
MDLVWRGGSSDVPVVDLTAPGISFSGSRGTWRSPLEGARSLGGGQNEDTQTDGQLRQRPPSRAEQSRAEQSRDQPGHGTWTGPVGGDVS